MPDQDHPGGVILVASIFIVECGWPYHNAQLATNYCQVHGSVMYAVNQLNQLSCSVIIVFISNYGLALYTLLFPVFQCLQRK